MGGYKVLLLDVDGVMLIPPRPFSQDYCQKHGIDPAEQAEFYASKEFKDASIGKFDLKDAIRLHHKMWQWRGDPQLLLDMWFEAENRPNEALFNVVREVRAAGTFVYLATQQEKYRAKFLEEDVFKDKIDGAFISCDLGYHKADDQFWQGVLGRLGKLHPNVRPGQIGYFDDRQNMVDKARAFGIDAHHYTDVARVKEILA